MVFDTANRNSEKIKSDIDDYIFHFQQFNKWFHRIVDEMEHFKNFRDDIKELNKSLERMDEFIRELIKKQGGMERHLRGIVNELHKK